MILSPAWWIGQALALLARFLDDHAARRRAEDALRDLGAAGERERARQAAEAAEAGARAAGAAAAEGADDPRDLRPETPA